MDIKDLASIAGVLGFFISIATFVITRIERRRKLVIELFQGSYMDFSKAPSETLIDEKHAPDLIRVRVTNIGGVPVIVNPESFYIRGNGENVTTNNADWLGIQTIPSPLLAGSSFEVACFEDAFEHLLKCNLLDDYIKQDEYEKTRIQLEAGFTDHNGNSFETRDFNYLYAVCSLERNT